jgi:formamidopyrimidine-DNA glycosylase
VPELPDVEGFRRYFVEHAAGRAVRSVWVDPTILRNASERAVRAALAGQRFEDPERRGKWLVCWTDGPALLLHFGMTGQLVSSRHERERHRWDRLILVLDDGEELRYRNMRKLGGVWLAHDPTEVGAIVGHLGPDALRVTRKEFERRLRRRRGGLKAALMDQSFVSGVGNIFADEILWQARLHPQRPVPSLSDDERRVLFDRMRSILRGAASVDDYHGAYPRWLARVRGRPDAPCPRCGTPLRRATVAGRTTYWCPACQADTPEGN